MSIVRQPHEIALADWVEFVISGLGFAPVIFSDEGNVKPSGAYAFVRVLTDVAAGPLEVRGKRVSDTIGQHRTIDRRTGTVSVTIVKGDGYGAALALERSYTKQAVIDHNEARGITVRGSVGGITPLLPDSGGSVSPRVVIDFQYAYTNEDIVEDDEFVQSATVTGAYTYG